MIAGIRPSTSKERSALFIETLLNITDLVSKVSPNSVLSGTGGGIGKISGKAEIDSIMAISQLFPDHAFGDNLDQVAENFGIAGRFNSLGSSTYVRVYATPGTVYLQATHFFIANNGTVFQLEGDYTMNAFGFAYLKVNSTTQGLDTAVDPLSISKISPVPAGHQNVINEYAAFGGRDIESDQIFRPRIKDGANLLARGTIAMLEQVFIKINNKVLRLFHDGTDLNGAVNIAIATQDGSDLSGSELSALIVNGSSFFSLTEYSPFGTSFSGIILKPMEYQPYDVSFRVQLDDSVDPDDVRRDIQAAMSKYGDFRFFDAATDKIEWVNLLQIVKSTTGVKQCPDNYFFPNSDIAIDINKLPRLRGFLMLDLSGNIIANFSGTLSPIYYPNTPDFSFISTVLSEI